MKLAKIASLLSLFFPLLVVAQTAEKPLIKSGDEWSYQTTVETGASGWKQTHDTYTVVRVTSSSIYLSVQQKGAPTAPSETITALDWSRVRNVDGKETIVNQPLAFPLQQGKAWDINYTEHNPNKVHTLEQWKNHYKVVGYESVEVAAGKFNAIKIEAEGDWIAEIAPSKNVVQMANVSANGVSMATQANNIVPSKATGRTYRAFWYVPEVGRWVKVVEEYYNSGGVRNQRFTSELEAYKLADR